MKKFYFSVAFLFLLAGCSEPTYDSSNKITQVDSVVSMLNELSAEQRRDFFQLYVLYLQPYENKDGNSVKPDLKKLQGMTTEEVMAELWEHYDALDYASQHSSE